MIEETTTLDKFHDCEKNATIFGDSTSLIMGANFTKQINDRIQFKPMHHNAAMKISTNTSTSKVQAQIQVPLKYKHKN